MSGGKVVKLDRVTFENIADEQTALSALQAGEIDFYEVPPQDLIDELKKDRNLTVEVLNKTGHIAFMRLNHLHPPFNNPDARERDAASRQAGRRDARDLRPVEVVAGVRLVFRLRHADDATTRTPSGSRRGRTSPRRRSCSQKAGYDGKPVVVLQATDHYLANPAGLFAAQWLRQAGINVDLAAMDWGALLTRRAVKKPPAEGGWNIFSTTVTGITFCRSDLVHRPGGERREGLVRLADRPDCRKSCATNGRPRRRSRSARQIAKELQKNGWDYVPHVILGQFFRNSAWRKNVTRRDRHARGGRLLEHGEGALRVERCGGAANSVAFPSPLRGGVRGGGQELAITLAQRSGANADPYAIAHERAGLRRRIDRARKEIMVASASSSADRWYAFPPPSADWAVRRGLLLPQGKADR